MILGNGPFIDFVLTHISKPPAFHIYKDRGSASNIMAPVFGSRFRCVAHLQPGGPVTWDPGSYGHPYVPQWEAKEHESISHMTSGIRNDIRWEMPSFHSTIHVKVSPPRDSSLALDEHGIFILSVGFLEWTDSSCTVCVCD